MAAEEIDGTSVSTRAVPKPEIEDLVELVRHLHGELESYAPTWYTEDMDIRVTRTLDKFTRMEGDLGENRCHEL